MVINKWDLVDLRVYTCVVRRGSFVAAATELGISPAYVSKRIANLEQALGASLIHRTTRRIHVTDEGEVADAWARKVLEAAEDLASTVANSKAQPSGALRISTSLRLGRNHVSHVLTQLAQTYPGLDIWLELVDRRVDVLAEGIDIDIRVGEVAEPHLVAHRVCRSQRILCAAPRYLAERGVPRTLSELTQHDCLLFRDREQAFGVWRMTGPHGPETVKVRGSLGSNHSDPVKNFAVDGRGITLLSVWDVATELESGAIQRVLPDYHQEADVWAVTAARGASSTRVKVCLDFLIKHLQTGPFALDTRALRLKPAAR